MATIASTIVWPRRPDDDKNDEGDEDE
jgi:hypothetical protein